MTRDEFSNLLRQATKSSIDLAELYVENELPESARYHVSLNQSYDGNATSDERLYPEDNSREVQCMTGDQVAALLVRENRCPEWIDVFVEAQSVAHTYFRLCCCGRFTDDPSKMYYTAQGRGPFGVKSPVLPMDFVTGSKFRVPTVTDGV